MDRQCSCILSNVTQRYLAAYRRILDEMRRGMTGAALTDSISQNFIVQMIPHHRAAIEMSENILQYTTCVPLQKIAEGIITEQTQSIADMEAILPICSIETSPAQTLCRYRQEVDRIISTMLTAMDAACAENNVNADFMREMIPHHRGAVELSRTALCYPIRSGLCPILEAIITSQTKGICQMQRLLDAIGCN